MKRFNQVDAQTAAALLRMKSPEMASLLTFIKTMMTDTDRALRRAQGDEILQLQGQAMFLEEFLAAVESSATVLEKFNQKQT